MSDELIKGDCPKSIKGKLSNSAKHTVGGLIFTGVLFITNAQRN